jgi:hypothetical protein
VSSPTATIVADQRIAACKAVAVGQLHLPIQVAVCWRIRGNPETARRVKLPNAVIALQSAQLHAE